MSVARFVDYKWFGRGEGALCGWEVGRKGVNFKFHFLTQ